jgi:hypothetical protein
MSSPPTAKRIKLEEFESQAKLHELDTATALLDEDESGEHTVDNENTCSICLQLVVDRTVIPKCSHEFCFECLLVWTGIVYVFVLGLTHDFSLTRPITPMSTLFPSYRTVPHTFYQIAVRLSQTLSATLTDITPSVSSSSK